MVERPLDEQLLDARLGELERARLWSPRAVAKLEALIRTGTDAELFRINPLQYAADRGLSQNEAIDLFLHATKVGLMEMEWQLVCPSCGHIVARLGDLASVHSHISCESCFVEVDLTLDDYIQIAFTVALLIRGNRYRDPSALSAEEFFFRYSTSQEALFTDGNKLIEVMHGFTQFADYLPPHQTTRIQLDLNAGLLQLISFVVRPSVNFVVASARSGAAQKVQVQVTNEGYQSVSHSVVATDVARGVFVHKFPRLAHLSSGQAVLEVDNRLDEPTPLWVRFAPPGAGSEPLTFTPFLSGKRLLTTQTFRDLFRSGADLVTEGLAIKNITFLFTDLKGSTALYEEIGDAKAYYLVRQHFDSLARVVVENNGAIVKTIGDAVMATFMTPLDAVRAAIGMINELGRLSQGITHKLNLKVGIHNGHSFAVTLNERVDYFGQTVNIAARVQTLADGSEIFITDDVFQYPGVQARVSSFDVTVEKVTMKGITNKLLVYKICIPAGL